MRVTIDSVVVDPDRPDDLEVEVNNVIAMAERTRRVVGVQVFREREAGPGEREVWAVVLSTVGGPDEARGDEPGGQGR